jgi:hypothetical protein
LVVHLFAVEHKQRSGLDHLLAERGAEVGVYDAMIKRERNSVTSPITN